MSESESIAANNSRAEHDNTCRVTVYTCMGKGHHFTVPFFTYHDELLFIDAVDFSAPSDKRQETIVSNTTIPTLIKSEPCCSLIVEHTNCDQTLRLTFSGSLKANVNNSISYDKMERHVTLRK